MALEPKRTYLAVARYEPDTVRRLLEYWAEYEASGHIPGKPFEEGGAIERRGIATEGGFAPLARQYGDLGDAVSHLPQLQREAVTLRWRYDLRVRDIAAKLQRRTEVVGDAVWLGTEWTLERLTRQDGMNTYVRLWRQSLLMRRK